MARPRPLPPCGRELCARQKRSRATVPLAALSPGPSSRTTIPAVASSSSRTAPRRRANPAACGRRRWTAGWRPPDARTPRRPGLVVTVRLRQGPRRGRGAQQHEVSGAADCGVRDHFRGEGQELDGGAGQRLPGVEPGQDEQLLDRGAHPGGLVLDSSHRQVDLLISNDAVVEVEVGPALHGAQRRAQLVRGVGDEGPHHCLAAVSAVEGVVEGRAYLSDLGAGVRVVDASRASSPAPTALAAAVTSGQRAKANREHPSQDRDARASRTVPIRRLLTRAGAACPPRAAWTRRRPRRRRSPHDRRARPGRRPRAAPGGPGDRPRRPRQGTSVAASVIRSGPGTTSRPGPRRSSGALTRTLRPCASYRAR